MKPIIKLSSPQDTPEEEKIYVLELPSTSRIKFRKSDIEKEKKQLEKEITQKEERISEIGEILKEVNKL